MLNSVSNFLAQPGRNASYNYGIGSDGRIVLIVNERDRPWGSSSGANDHQAVVIGVANNTGAPAWGVSEAALAALHNLVECICRRNNIPRLIYDGTANGTLTRHNFFANTTCPGPFLQERFPQIAEELGRRLGATPAPQPAAPPPANVPSGANDKAIWDFFTRKGLNAFAVAGIMGNLFAESALRPNNLQDVFNRSLGMTDEQYTAAVDDGTYTNFVQDRAGYGLAQWTFWSRKEAFYNFMRAEGVSIGALQMQLEFMWRELQGYTNTMLVLRKAASVLEASNVVLHDYLKPAVQDEAVQQRRAGYGKGYWARFAAHDTAPPEPQAGFVVGDIVQFTGGGVFISSTAHTPAHSRGASRARVTQVAPRARNQYHLVSEDGGRVHGWVLSGDVVAIGAPAPATPPAAPEPLPHEKRSIDEIAREVIRGNWGNGVERRNRLTAAGYDPAAVQRRVNELMR